MARRRRGNKVIIDDIVNINVGFLNDEFHATGHKCGPYYNIKYYKDSTFLSYLIDSKIEEINKIIKY